MTEQETYTILTGVITFHVALWVTCKYFPRFVIVPFLAFSVFALWFSFRV